MKKLVALMVALTMVLGLASVASAAEYPSKGISVICPWGAGGGTDAVLRAFCEAMGKDLGVTLTVDNRTGGGGIIGHQAIADAEPDGYTIGMITFELSTYKHLGTCLLYTSSVTCRIARLSARIGRSNRRQVYRCSTIAARNAIATQYEPTPMLATTLNTCIFSSFSSANTLPALSTLTTSRVIANMRHENRRRRTRGSSFARLFFKTDRGLFMRSAPPYSPARAPL